MNLRIAGVVLTLVAGACAASDTTSSSTMAPSTQTVLVTLTAPSTLTTSMSGEETSRTR